MTAVIYMHAATKYCLISKIQKNFYGGRKHITGQLRSRAFVLID